MNSTSKYVKDRLYVTKKGRRGFINFEDCADALVEVYKNKNNERMNTAANNTRNIQEKTFIMKTIKRNYEEKKPNYMDTPEDKLRKWLVT